MEPIDRQPPDSLEPASDAELDALLAEARWPEPSAASRQRLLATWSAVSPARRRDGVRWTLAAAAAVVVLASGLVIVVTRQPNSAHHTTAQVGETSQQQPQPAPPTTMPAQPPRTPLLYMAGSREPNMRERLAMGRDALRPQPRTKLTPAMPATPPAETVGAFLARVADPATRESALAELDGPSRPSIDALLNELDNPKASLRYAAARALGRIDGPATTAALVARINARVAPRQTIAALLCSAGDDTAAQVVQKLRTSPQWSAIVRSAENQLQFN